MAVDSAKLSVLPGPSLMSIMLPRDEPLSHQIQLRHLGGAGQIQQFHAHATESISRVSPCGLRRCLDERKDFLRVAAVSNGCFSVRPVQKRSAESTLFHGARSAR